MMYSPYTLPPFFHFIFATLEPLSTYVCLTLHILVDAFIIPVMKYHYKNTILTLCAELGYLASCIRTSRQRGS